MIEQDPRVYFAAERTLLAWIRTGLATIALGFVVARFGLFLRLLRRDADAALHLGSTLLGVGLVVLGSLAIAGAAWQHVRYCRRLDPGARPRPNAMVWSVAFSALIALIGAALAAYLLARSSDS